MPKPTPCLKVAKQDGEAVLAAANRLALTDKTLLIKHEPTGKLCIPLIKTPTEEEMASIVAKVADAQLTSMDFEEKKRNIGTLAEALEAKLPPHLLASLPHSMDIVGDIAIIEIPLELETHKAAVGAAVMQVHRNVRVVMAKSGKVSGTFRLRELEFIAGERRTGTLYKENGCSYEVDVAQAYFSPRLSHERQRVALQVETSEVVVDLFAGVGPFAVLIAKMSGAKVFALDINPDAVELIKRNARLNRVEDRVFPIFGDARKIINDQLAGTGDRVIMNLPETAYEFVDVACQALKRTGGIIHFYGFVRAPDTLENLQSSFAEAIERASRKVLAFCQAKAVRETAPFECQVVLDAEVA